MHLTFFAFDKIHLPVTCIIVSRNCYNEKILLNAITTLSNQKRKEVLSSLLIETKQTTSLLVLQVDLTIKIRTVLAGKLSSISPIKLPLQYSMCWALYTKLFQITICQCNQIFIGFYYMCGATTSSFNSLIRTLSVLLLDSTEPVHLFCRASNISVAFHNKVFESISILIYFLKLTRLAVSIE